MLTDTQVLYSLGRMPPDMRALFDLLPSRIQEAYLSFWETRPDSHGAHRDTLPAFVAGAMTGLR
jgi:hypothetical protein